MSDHHRLYVEHTLGNVKVCAKEIGLNTLKLVIKILDQQVVHSSYKILIDGKISMQEHHGLGEI